jgi:GNAT superfamily N-acetyltransferase
MMDEMAAPYFAGDAPAESWFVVDTGMPIAIGYCAPERMTEDTANLLLIAVHPDHQRHGYGRALIGEVERDCLIRGDRMLLIETSGLPEFAGQRAFYAGLGYGQEARIRDYYRAGEDKVVFRKLLGPTLRPAEPEDIAAMQALERDAAKTFADLPGMAFCVDIPARDDAEHREAQARGLALLAESHGEAVGFLIAVPRDGCAHLLEVGVAAAWQGQGVGRRLIEAFESWARETGFREATLTTYRDVAWNAPFYRRLGYQAFEPGDNRPELKAVIAEEASHGVDRAPRLVMHKAL